VDVKVGMDASSSERADSERTACPLLKGCMSRNASTLSDSKSLSEGMSPKGSQFRNPTWSNGRTLDDLAKDARCHVVLLLTGVEGQTIWCHYQSESRDWVQLRGNMVRGQCLAWKNKGYIFVRSPRPVGVGRARAESISCLLPEMAVATPKILHLSIFGQLSRSAERLIFGFLLVE